MYLISSVQNIHTGRHAGTHVRTHTHTHTHRGYYHHRNVLVQRILSGPDYEMTSLRTDEACIGVIGIQDICHFTSSDIGYYPFYLQGYRILCSISGILCFLPKNKKNKKNSKSPFERRELKKKTFIRKIFLTYTTLLF